LKTNPIDRAEELAFRGCQFLQEAINEASQIQWSRLTKTLKEKSAIGRGRFSELKTSRI